MLATYAAVKNRYMGRADSRDLDEEIELRHILSSTMSTRKLKALHRHTKVVTLYTKYRLSVSEIAKKLRMSSGHVSLLLKETRESG